LFFFAFQIHTGNLRPAMTPHEETSPEGPAPSKRAQPRRSRRGGRGRRRPAARPPTEVGKPSSEVQEQGSNIEEGISEPTALETRLDSAGEDFRGEIAPPEEREGVELQERREERPIERPVRHERRDFKPAEPAAVTEAIEEVNVIIISLKQVLDQMEEILETLELAEVQKTADEREIQSLRNALRQFDRRAYTVRQEQPQGRERDEREQRGPEPRRRGER